MVQNKTQLLFRHRSMEMGGIENVLLTILAELDLSQYDITLLLTYQQGEFLHRIPKNIKVLSIAEGIEHFSKNKWINIFQKMIRRIKYWRFQKNPRSFYKKHQLLEVDYEIAFSHYMFEDTLASPNKKSKKIFWYHGDLRNSGFSEKGKLEIIHQMQQFHKGVFVSEFSKNIVEKTWKVSLDKAQVIHNPLLTDEILVKSKVPVKQEFGKINFISIGRLFWQKGFLDLLNAHIRLKNEGYDIRTLILGEGMQRTELEQIIKKHKVENSFILAGYQANPYPYLKNADYFILPSYSEGYPLVIAEALLVDTFVLSTHVGGISEMITSEKFGILFEPGEEQVYQAMKKVLSQNMKKNTDLGRDILIKNHLIFTKIKNLFVH